MIRVKKKKEILQINFNAMNFPILFNIYDEIYMLSLIRYGEYSLISLNGGNRWLEPNTLKSTVKEGWKESNKCAVITGSWEDVKTIIDEWGIE